MNILQDKDGKTSSFRIIWAATVISIVGTWAFNCIATKTMQPFPLDSMGLLALLVASPAKTASENLKKQ
jgi:hypothetical protein